jgi:hypothetical protein
MSWQLERFLRHLLVGKPDSDHKLEVVAGQDSGRREEEGPRDVSGCLATS